MKIMEIDFHAHILPEMDHGCRNMDMCQEQLNMAAKQQIEVVVATSHFYPHTETVESFLTRREKAFEKLTAERVEQMPKVLLGAEVLICSGMDKMERLQELCVEGTNVLLFEMPFADMWEQDLIDTVARLKNECKLQVVLAHAERYRLSEVEKLLTMGVLVQLNTASLASFRELTRHVRARKLLKRSCVVALGSDIHGTQDQYEVFSKAVKKYHREAEIILQKTSALLKDVLV